MRRRLESTPMWAPWGTMQFLSPALLVALTVGACYSGSYSCYSAACNAARYLRKCGYATTIVRCYGCYAVYYYR